MSNLEMLKSRMKKTVLSFVFSMTLFGVFFGDVGYAEAAVYTATFKEKCAAIGGTYNDSGGDYTSCTKSGTVIQSYELDKINNLYGATDAGKKDAADWAKSQEYTATFENKCKTVGGTFSDSATGSMCTVGGNKVILDYEPDKINELYGVTDAGVKDAEETAIRLKEEAEERAKKSAGGSTTSDGKVDPNIMTYILISVILVVGIKTTLSLATDAASFVNKGLSGVTGGKIKSIGQPFGSALSKVRKSAGTAAGRPFKVAGQVAKGVGYNIAKGDSFVGKGIRKTSAFMQSSPLSETSLQRQKAKAEQAKKGYAKALGKEDMMKKLNAPTDDEVKEEMEGGKMTSWSADALTKKITDEKASEKERKAAAMALSKISKGETSAVPDAVNDAKEAINRLQAQGLKNKDGKFDDFNKKEFTAALKGLQKPSEAIFKKDSSGNVSGVDMAKLASVDIGSIDPSSMDSVKIAAVNSVMSGIQSQNTAVNSVMGSLSSGATASSEQKQKIEQAVFSGDLSTLEDLKSNNLITDADFNSLKAVMASSISESDRNNYHNALMISRKFEGHKKAEAARSTAGRFKSVSSAFNGNEKAYHQKVMSDMNTLSGLATGSSTTDFLDRAVNIFAEHRADYNDAKSITDVAQRDAALQALQKGIMEKVKYTQDVTRLALGNKSERAQYNTLAGKGKKK